MSKTDLDERHSLPEESYTPWWQLMTVFGLAMSICVGICLLM